MTCHKRAIYLTCKNLLIQLIQLFSRTGRSGCEFDLSTTCDERFDVCTGLQVLKLVVLNKAATFRLQTSTKTVELGRASQGYHSQAADFLSRSENRSGWKTFSPAVPVMAAGCKIQSTNQIYAQLQL